MSDVSTVNDDRRGLRVLLGVLAAVVLLALLWFFVISPLLLSGDAGDPAAETPAPAPTATDAPADVAPTEPTDADDTLAALPIETYEIFLSRDPFDPVVPTDAGTDGGDGDGSAGDGNGGTDGDGDGNGDGGPGDGTDDGVPRHDAVLIDVFTDEGGQTRALIRVGDRIFTVTEGDTFADGYDVVAIEGTCVTLTYQGQTFSLCEGGGGTGDPGGGQNGGDGATGACSGDEEVVCEGRVVTLVDVFVRDGEPVAVVQVDSTLYEVRRGDDFAQNFRVMSIDPPCVTLLYGDDAFTLCEGQRTLK